MNTPNAIRTVVVDDSPEALRAICSIVERQPNLAFVGAATNGWEGLLLARSLKPDLVLLDLEMPIMGGVEATSCLEKECPGTAIVIVTGHDTPTVRKLCFERGARGFVTKECLDEELPIVVRELFGNGS